MSFKDDKKTYLKISISQVYKYELKNTYFLPSKIIK